MTTSTATVGLQLISLLVKDYDEAIDFYVNKLGFVLVTDTPATSSKGKKKRWVVVKPPGNPQCCGILLALADGPEQLTVLVRSETPDTGGGTGQFGGRVGLFWRVDDFDKTYARLQKAGVEFCEDPRSEVYGKVVVFKDLVGNKWDLLGPASSGAVDVAANMTNQ